MPGHQVVNASLKQLTRILCRVDDEQLVRVPDQGPLIVVANHINFLEIPLLASHLHPRPITGLAKSETWDNPALRVLFNLWGAIPLRRGQADVPALRQALVALETGAIVAMAPEGTRSGHGRLQRGHPGVVFLALQSGAPLLPLGFYGSERFWENLPRLRRTDFNIVVGQPFCLHGGDARSTRTVRQQMVDEVMYQLAALLPPANRGVYADLDAATETFIRFPPGAQSNLLRAADIRVV
jgi:1-acyl-sn-glycerol-3-phosphate acyltransferase